jgi:putative endopeptidase
LPLKELVENWNISGLVQYGFANPSHFEVFNSMYVEENLEIIKTLCILKLISSFANCLDKDFEQIQIDFNNQIYGFSLSESKETAAINFLKNSFSDLFGKVWIKNYFSDEIKKDVEKIIYQILEEYKKEINSWNWMGAGSRYNLTVYLNELKVFVGYYDFF